MTKVFRLLTVLFTLSLAACAVAPRVDGKPLTEASIDVAANGSAWEVHYTLPRPVAALRFARVDYGGTRARGWQPLDPKLEVLAGPDGEVVRRRDGATFSEASFAMQPRYEKLENDYAPFSPFGDGGMLIHSGRLHVCAGRCEGGVENRWRVRITPPAGAHVIHGGKVVPKVDFYDAQPGTNIYIGRARPVATSDVVAVIDTTMPTGIRDRLATLLPRLMDLYGQELGRLPTRPMLYASRDEQHPGGGYGYQGGTLPGQVFMHVYGRNDEFSTGDFAKRMDSFFAHEAVHLYQRVPPLAEKGDSWIHEGGAEAMALLALTRMGEIESAEVQEIITGAIASCAEGIRETPLIPLPATGRFELTYTCGLVVQMAVDAAGRRAPSQSCDLFCVWREFQRRVDAGAPWTTATFVQVVSDRVGPGAANLTLKAVTTSPDDPVAFLQPDSARGEWAAPPASRER